MSEFPFRSTSVKYYRCVSCHFIQPYPRMDRTIGLDDFPRCPRCGGAMKFDKEDRRGPNGREAD